MQEKYGILGVFHLLYAKSYAYPSESPIFFEDVE